LYDYAGRGGFASGCATALLPEERPPKMPKALPLCGARRCFAFMNSKKICLLGGFATGKTSLVERYVHSIFSDKYLSTVGVKISKKAFSQDGTDVMLILWDMEGEDVYADVNLSYVRGAMGFFVVADGTRKETLETALNLRRAALEITGQMPSCLLINKADIADQWEITEAMLAPLAGQGVTVRRTSAKTGMGVEEAFAWLTREMLER
jgi:small GTP-binding protein